MKLWGSRMARPTDKHVQQLNASLPFDIRLYQEDIDSSLAWARSLQQAGVLDELELQTLVQGLEAVRREFEEGSFAAQSSDEDIHTAVERRLTELIGPTAGKLHTGRSRNDQVATDFRLWVMRACEHQIAALSTLLEALLERAAAGLADPMPGYTHLQQAQPITWGHWMLSHVWPLLRDRKRFADAWHSAAILPLGSGALAGTPLAIDRQRLADELGFDAISQNSLDAVADRDFALEFLFAAATAGVHLSRLAEQLILFSSAEFGFVSLDDSDSTGSSLMPQKKNPDPLELARGKAGRLIGDLSGLLATLKGLPSAYDKDLQEDKEPLFDAHDTLGLLLPALAGLISRLRTHPARMLAAIDPALFATDLADVLVARGVPFRQAHDLVGKAVRRAETQGLPLSELPLEQLQAIDPAFEHGVGEAFDLQASLARRASVGGTGPEALRAGLQAARRALSDQD